MQERKVLPNDWRNQLYKNKELFVEGKNGNTFGSFTKTKNYLLKVKTETHSALGLDNTTSTR